MSKGTSRGIADVIKLIGIGVLGALGASRLSKWLLARTARQNIKKIMTEPYDKNLWELLSAGMRATSQVIVETNLRAQDGKKLLRPIGGPKKFPDFSGLMFDVAQLAKLPASEDAAVETSVILGKNSAKPLKLDIPIIISGMAYGFILSEKAKTALAKGASLAGTATNTGQGPFLPAERKAARHFILQYNRGFWSKEKEILQQADMIEIQLGHASRAGIGDEVKYKDIDQEVRKRLGLKPGQKAVAHSRPPGMSSPDELKDIVAKLRKITGGIPIGVKIAAGNSLEKDLSYILDAGADVISIDGKPGGSGGTLPILQDDFGLPTLFALCRAVKYLESCGAKEKVDLIISGGLYTPGDFLKALALGADAVGIGTIALFAMAHTQVLEALPFEPPIQVVYQKGIYQKKFDIDKGARHLANYLTSCTEEMREAVRALGKTSISQVSRDDLLALDRNTAEIAGVPFGGINKSILSTK